MARSRLIDVVAAAATASAVTVSAFVAAVSAAEPAVRAAAYLLGITLGGLVLFRRRYPVPVLLGSATIVMGYNLAGFPGIPPIWALVVPLYTVARTGRVRVGAAVGITLELISAAWVLGGANRSLGLLDGTLREAVVLALVLVTGVAVHNRELFAREVTARLAVERDRRDRATRLRIARELHDVTAHTVAVVGIQINLARELVTTDPAAARDLLDSTRRINADAMGELTAAVRLLRDDPEVPQRQPVPDQTLIPALLEHAVSAGLAVRFEEHGEPRPLPAAVGLTLYRVAQESVTNVLRHARAATVRAVLTYRPGSVNLEITDDGIGPADPGAGGSGLVGMRERAESLGGTLTVGSSPGDTGFSVRMSLPA